MTGEEEERLVPRWRRGRGGHGVRAGPRARDPALGAAPAAPGVPHPACARVFPLRAGCDGGGARGITRDYMPFLLILQGMTLQLQGIALSPF